MPRIDKVLSIRGGYSRKVAAKMIRQGRVKLMAIFAEKIVLKLLKIAN